MVGTSSLFRTNVHARLLGRRICLFAFSLITVWLVSGCASNKSTQTTGAEPAPVTDTMSATEQRRYQQALKSLTEGDSVRAEDGLRALSTQHPNDPGIWINLATAYYHNQKLDDAAAALKHASEIKADIPEIHNLSGLIAVEAGDYASAKNAYLTALEIDDSYADAHHNLGLLYDIFYQNFPQAIVHYERYLALTGSEDQITADWAKQLRRSMGRESER